MAEDNDPIDVVLPDEAYAPFDMETCPDAGIAAGSLLSGCGCPDCPICRNEETRLNIGPCMGGVMNGSLLSGYGTTCRIETQNSGTGDYIWIELAPLMGCWLHEPCADPDADLLEAKTLALASLMACFHRTEARFHDKHGEIMAQMGQLPGIMH